MLKIKFGRIILNLMLIFALVFPVSILAANQDQIQEDTSATLELASQYYADTAKESGADTDRPSANGLTSVIVKLDFEPLATYRGGVDGLSATTPTLTGETKLNAQSAPSRAYLAHVDTQINAFETNLTSALPGAKVVHRYRAVIGGVSVILPDSELDRLLAVPGVVGYLPDQLNQLETEVSPEFIGAPTIWGQLGGQESAGEGVVVGILDSGIWPEHPSFSDPDPFGNAFPAPPGGPYACDFGNTAYNPDDVAFSCNNKLIGAHFMLNTYSATLGLLPTEFASARDDNGHGNHTASTAAGNGGVPATVLGVDRGVVSGIAPRAHVIAYKVCGDQGCFGSDSAAAVEQAVLDGVDVTNFSISGGGDPYNDTVEVAFLDAYAAGVFAAHSAGNSGPGADTVAHRGPWVTTVGASTSDRHFLSTITLSGILSGTTTVTETLDLVGATLTEGILTATTVVDATDFGDGSCLTPFAAGTFSGEIVICQRGTIARVEKSFNVAEGGAGGLLLYNPTQQGLATDNHFIPSVHLENDAGADLLDFMANHTDVTATFTQGVASTVLGDMMADFSSRGGPGQTLGISKPDITAPGVQILAGHTPLPATVEGGLPGELFQSIQGTSMSSPHIAGSGALIKALHPDWTPGQIKSALMTTALTAGVVKEDGMTAGDPFDYGSGRVDLTKAGDPGLTFDVPFLDYITHQNDLWNVNYPSLYVPVLPGEVTVNRTAASQLVVESVWSLSITSPDDLAVDVPASLTIPAMGEATFPITIDARDVPDGEVRHAHLQLTHGPHEVNFPITIVRGQAGVTLEKTCDMSILAYGDISGCTITATNTTFASASIGIQDTLPEQLVISGTVTGATQSGNSMFFNGSLDGAAPPNVNVAVDSTASPAGYLSLAGFTPLVLSQSDESISNVTVPSFEFAGETYDTIGVVSNGYIVVGGGTGADVDFINSDLPDAAIPNNVLAPFWTDLNPATGGRVLVELLTDGLNSWVVTEWEGVPIFSSSTVTNTFQVWISYSRPDDVSFTYGADISSGDGGFLTVGAENDSGSSGGTTYFDGVGTPPAPSNPFPGYEVDVFTSPGAPGESHVISYDVIGDALGRWQNCAEMSSDAFAGSSIACFSGLYGTETFMPASFKDYMLPLPPASVRAVHASPDAPNVDVLVDGGVAFADVPFTAVSVYADLPPSSYLIQVVPTGAITPTVISATLPLAADTDYTVIALNDLANIEPLVLVDDNSTPAAGFAHVRFVHASPDTPAVDIAVAGGGPVLFSNVAFKEIGTYLPVVAGTYDLEVLLTGTSTVVLSVPGVALVDGTVYTVYAMGFAASTPALSAQISVDN